MTVLVLSEGSIVFYDLTSIPPVQRNAERSVEFSEGSTWRRASVMRSYPEAELAAILTYLRAVIKP